MFKLAIKYFVNREMQQNFLQQSLICETLKLENFTKLFNQLRIVKNRNCFHIQVSLVFV